MKANAQAMRTARPQPTAVAARASAPLRAAFLLSALAIIVLSSARLLAQEVCTADTLEEMKSLDADMIANHATKPEISQIQRCLVHEHCYEQDPDKIDGTFGRYTQAAFGRFTSGHCYRHETLSKSEGPVFCTLTPECLTTLTSGAACALPSLSASSTPIQVNPHWLPNQCVDPNKPAIPAQSLADALSPMKNVNYPSPELFVSQMKYLACSSDKPSIRSVLETKWENLTLASCHPYSEATQIRSWTLDWTVPMSRELSEPVFGFYPLAAPSSPTTTNAQNANPSSNSASTPNQNTAGSKPQTPSSTSNAQNIPPTSQAPNNQNFTSPAQNAPPAPNPSQPAAPSGNTTNSSASNPTQNPAANSASNNRSSSTSATGDQAAAQPSAPKSSASEGNLDASEKIDFGTLRRVEWFSGVTISDSMQLERSSTRRPLENIELARRFDVSVDLVIYKRADEQWLRTVEEKPARIDLIDALARSIADMTGKAEDGFLNRTQRYLLPSVLTTAPTHWDGVTLYFEDFPFDNANALDFLVTLLQETRKALDQKQTPRRFSQSNTHSLALNLVIPFSHFVPDPGDCFKNAPNGELLEGLARLVPNSWPGNLEAGGKETTSSDTSSSFASKVADAEQERSWVDSFIVFLPQPTSENKKCLRFRVENDFEEVKLSKITKAYAYKRAQIFRKIIYILSPVVDTSAGTGSSTSPGAVEKSHLTDDMIYAKENFGGVGFWPLPGYGQPKEGERSDFLAGEIRAVFIADSPGSMSPAWLAVIENFFFAFRREVFVFLECILLLLAAYGVCALWLFELRAFFHAHLSWFLGLILFMLGILYLLFLSNPRLKNYLPGFIVAIVLAALVSFAAWAYISKLEKDLP